MIATFGSGLAVLVVGGAIIGAITAGAGQVVTNLAAGKKWNEGLGTAMLIGGLLGPLGMPGIGGVFSSAGSRSRAPPPARRSSGSARRSRRTRRSRP